MSSSSGVITEPIVRGRFLWMAVVLVLLSGTGLGFSDFAEAIAPHPAPAHTSADSPGPAALAMIDSDPVEPAELFSSSTNAPAAIEPDVLAASVVAGAAVVSASPATAELANAHVTLVATALVTEGAVQVWAEPDLQAEPTEAGEILPAAAATWNLAVPTEFGGPRHFAVVSEQGDWLEIQVPVRPNETTGWIPRSAVTLSEVTTAIQVDLSERSVVVTDKGEVVMSVIGTVGSDANPTPTGSYYIRDSFPWYPDSVYGPWVMALSAYSETIDQINGGSAVTAIHGTVRPDLMGQAGSLGCVRLENETLLQLAELVSVGTPVIIVD